MSNNTENLLWIDDDGEERFPYECRLLQKAGYEIFWARSGQQAAEQLLAQSYEVILLDQQLPWQEGVSHVWGGVMLYAWATTQDRPREAPPLDGFDQLFSCPREKPIQAQVRIVSAFYNEGVATVQRELGLPDAEVFAKPIDMEALLISLGSEPA